MAKYTLLEENMIFYLFLSMVSGLIFAMSLVNLLGTQGPAKTPQTSEHAKQLIIMSYISVVVFGIALIVSLVFLLKTFPTFVRQFGMIFSSFHSGMVFTLILALAALMLSYGVITLQYEQSNEISYPTTGSCLGGSCNVMLINSVTMICLSSLVLLVQMIILGYQGYAKAMY